MSPPKGDLWFVLRTFSQCIGVKPVLQATVAVMEATVSKKSGGRTVKEPILFYTSFLKLWSILAISRAKRGGIKRCATRR